MSSIKDVIFFKDGYCDICNRNSIPALIMTIITSTGGWDHESEIGICKECFDINCSNDK
jgi:hypothetical protein